MDLPPPDAAAPTPALTERDLGDAARNGRDWAGAERHYRAWLEATPEDWAIWVQLGHACKEAGRGEAAEAAYREAMRLQPGEADPPLQLAHLLKGLGRREDAADAFATVLRLAPSQGAADELAALGAEALARELMAEWLARKPDDCLYLEITDLFVYLHDHRTVSGIQRVQLGLVAHVLALPAAERARYAFVVRQGEAPWLWLLPTERVQALASYVAGAQVERQRLDALLHAAKNAGAKAQPRAGQALVVLGAFWVGGAVSPAYAAAKAAGLRVGAYIYDLIPVTHPEFCDDRLVLDFAAALAEGMAFFDFLLAISEHSAAELRRWLARNGLDQVPVQAVPLAHDFRLPGQASLPAPSRWPEAVAPLQGREFVLCVGTIEVRKNHGYLFQLWKRLLDEGIEPPDLVLVGRHGWRVNDLYAQMQATGFLGGRIRVLHDLTDAELTMLYRHCLFTVFPSFVEGWGLPVGESLAQGKPCLASSASSVPEVGGALVDYIDPFNLNSGLAAVRHWLADRAALAAREAEIRASFRPRGWAEVGERFFAAARRLAAAPPRPAPRGLLPQGLWFRPAELRNPEASQDRALRLLLAEGWLPPDARGVQADPTAPAARLRFQTDAGAGGAVTLFLQLRIEEATRDTALLLTPAVGHPRRIALGAARPGPGGQTINLRLPMTADAEGVIACHLAPVLAPGAKPGKRRPTLRLLGLGHAAVDNLAARVALLEDLLFPA